ncbi:MAG TPA: DinB family protein, partial [Burkholderiaceae bacterium]
MQTSNPQRQAWRERYLAVRAHTVALVAPLSAEDQALQSMPDASPSKWHQAHTTWFFETLVLLGPASKPTRLPGYRPFDARFAYLFNSYYEALGARHPRPERGLLSRPDLATVQAYRRHVDAAMLRLIAELDDDAFVPLAPLIELGLHHEQQHQELILTDILHAFSCNPLLPLYSPAAPAARIETAPARWLAHPGGTVEIGHAGAGFAFDNETPRHGQLLQAFEIADTLVSCGDYLRFIEDGGYRRAEFWLSDGWAQARGWGQPS